MSVRSNMFIVLAEPSKFLLTIVANMLSYGNSRRFTAEQTYKLEDLCDLRIFHPVRNQTLPEVVKVQ
jgi:hypothetical protein